jgi:hypothetical protein
MASVMYAKRPALHRSLEEAKRDALPTISAFRRYANTPTRRHSPFAVVAPPRYVIGGLLQSARDLCCCWFLRTVSP